MTDRSINQDNLPVVVAITGASGALYSLTLLRKLSELKIPVDLIVSPHGMMTLVHECDISPELPLLESLKKIGIAVDEIRLHDFENLGAPPASGSYRVRAMIVCPCSVKTLSAISSGSCRSLIERAAEVQLKERRRLVLYFRESPYSLNQIESMRAVTLAGAVVMPASPAFYNRPSDIKEMVGYSVGRLLETAGIYQKDLPGWQGI